MKAYKSPFYLCVILLAALNKHTNITLIVIQRDRFTKVWPAFQNQCSYQEEKKGLKISFLAFFLAFSFLSFHSLHSPLYTHTHMQQNTSKSIIFLKYGVSIGFLALFFLVYQTEYNHIPAVEQEELPAAGTKSTKNLQKVSSADFLIDEQPQQQQYFNNSAATTPALLYNGTISLTNGSFLACSCPTPLPASLYSTENMTIVRHGEKQPIFVPDYISPLQPDIFDKIMAMRHHDKIREFEDNGILITIAGYAMKHELYNWIELLNSVKEDRFIVFCTDLKIYVHLIVAGYEDYAVYIPDDWFLGDLHLFRDTEYDMLDNEIARLSHVKTWVLQRLVYTRGINNVLYLDVNQVMLHARTREYITTLLNIRWDTELIASQDTNSQKLLNTGLLMLRTDTKSVKRLLANTMQIQETKPNLTQQQAFNLAVDQLDLHLKNGNTVLLDIMHFPNGVNYFEKNLSGSKGIEPYIVHVNHKVCGFFL
jgi:hypothetical protein